MGRMKKSIASLVTLCAFATSGFGQSGAAPAGATPSDGITMPDVKDPMLEPVPPPARELASWRQALELVHARSTALHISQAQVEQSRAATRRALAGALPQLTGNAGVTRYLLLGHGLTFDTTASSINNAAGIGNLPDPATQLTSSLDLRVPVIDFSTWYTVGTSRTREHVADENALDTQRILLGTVAQAAVGVITASRIAESSRVSLESALSTLELTQRRADLGAASAVDVLRAKQEVASSRAQIISANESLRQARESLGAALGDTVGWGVATSIGVDDLERTASSVCQVVDPTEARADIRSASMAVAAAERDRTSVDYKYLPSVDLASSLSYVNSTLISPNGNHVNWTLGGQLTWLLYDGGDRYGLRRSNEAALTIARETLTQKKRDVTLQVTQADRAITVAQVNLAVARTARDVAKEQARLSRLAFVNGSGTSFDLIDSTSKLRQAEIDLLIKDFQVFQARLTAFLARANCMI